MDEEHAHDNSLKSIESGITRYSNSCFSGPGNDLYGQFQNTGQGGNQLKATCFGSNHCQNKKCLPQSSTALRKVTLKDVFERNCASVDRPNAIADVSNICEGVLHEHTQKMRYITWREEASMSKLGCTHNDMPLQASMQRQEEGDSCNIYKRLPGVTVAGSSSMEKPTRTMSRQRATASDRLRRELINENLRALQGLLPNPTSGGQASALDEIIDHVKYLQLQLKDLTRSKLVEQLPADPLIFREGYGHYVHGQVLNEPLEEMMGQMLMVNPTAATRLLESRGLFIVPVSFVEESLE